MKKIVVVIAVLLAAASCQENKTEFIVAEPFQEGMVLPKGKELKVFGTADGAVKVEFAGVRSRCRAKDGKWCASLPALDAGGPYVMTITNKSSEIQINDVYVGNVIMIAGQSNLQFKLKASQPYLDEWGGDSLLRSFSLPHIEEGEPFTPEDGWVKCTDENAPLFSAVGYLAGSELRRRTGEAVGIVNCYQGASIIETWIPADRLDKPEYQLPKEQLHWDHYYEDYHKWNQNGVLYEKDIVPFAPYQLNAVVWYQGESNTGLGEYKIYPALFSEMAGAWREAFTDEKLPFVIVEIADFVRCGKSWPLLQKAQESIPETVANTVVVKSADVCDSLDIHPADKRALCLRIVDALENMDL